MTRHGLVWAVPGHAIRDDLHVAVFSFAFTGSISPCQCNTSHTDPSRPPRLHRRFNTPQGNAKTLEGNQSPEPDAQFRYLNEQARTRQPAGDPVVSVDTMKKELVGEYNADRERRPKGKPVRVSDHDFPDEELARPSRTGIYDLRAPA